MKTVHSIKILQKDSCTPCTYVAKKDLQTKQQPNPNKRQTQLSLTPLTIYTTIPNFPITPIICTLPFGRWASFAQNKTRWQILIEFSAAVEPNLNGEIGKMNFAKVTIASLILLLYFAFTQCARGGGRGKYYYYYYHHHLNNYLFIYLFFQNQKVHIRVYNDLNYLETLYFHNLLTQFVINMTFRLHTAIYIF